MSESKLAAPEPTEIAGRYQIIQKLGAGAFGTVAKAKDKILGRMVAIKTIRLEGLAAQGASIEELLERFKREAQVSAQLKHPNIVTIYDIGEAEGVSYLAMEFIDGVGLEKIIQSVGRLPVERVASIGSQVADALDFAHKHGVIHRDIKPANIMIETGDRVKVTDFGIAKVTSSADHLTMTGSLLGTPSYMSPEQARGAPIDGRSDLFSAGCILYEMLAGQKAFRGESITALIFKIITEEPPPLRELSADIPEGMIRIVTKALAKTPETRYQSGKELADDLAAFTAAGSQPTIRQAETPTARAALGDMPTLAQPPTPPTVAGPPPTVAAPAPAKPRPAPAPPRQASAAAPAVPRTATPPRPLAQAPQRRGGGIGLFVVLGLVALLFAGAAAGFGYYFFFVRKPAGPAVAESGPSATPIAPATGPVAVSPATTPAATPIEPTPAPASASATGRADSAPSAARPAVRPPSAATATAVEPRPAGPPASTDQAAGTPGSFSFLDRESEDAGEGVGSGGSAAEAFRRPGNRSGGYYGGTRYRMRDRSPRNLALPEMPAVAVLRHVINAENLFHRKNGRYGTLLELKAARVLYLDVPLQAHEFARRNYRFELELEADGFTVNAIPTSPGPRPFTGDDTGIIRPAD